MATRDREIAELRGRVAELEELAARVELLERAAR